MEYLLHHLVRSNAIRNPTKAALVSGEIRVTYSELQGRVAGFGAGLFDMGVRRGDRVGIFLRPSIEQAVSFFGISRAGAAFVPIHHSLFPMQITHIVRDCGIRALVIDKPGLLAIADYLADCHTLECLVLVGESVPKSGNVPIVSFDELCATDPGSQLNEVSIGQDMAAILYTSGSSGLPKGVMLSHNNLIAGASIVSQYLELSESDRTLAALPFSFDAGLNQLLTAAQNGATCVIQDWTFASELVGTMLEEKITGLAGVPSLWSLLAQPSAGLSTSEFPDLRYITNTGGAMPRNILSNLTDALPGVDIILMYGLTEAFRSTYLPADELTNRPSSMGKAIPNTEILVINSEGKRSKDGEVGELVHHGPTVSMGYWGQPELTAQVLRPHPDPPPGASYVPTVCYSGDLVKMDVDGYLYFVERSDNLIKSSGFRISPTEIEQVLCEVGKVQQAAVIGRPHAILGQSLEGYVVPRDGVTPDPQDLLEICTEHLPRHMVPKEIKVVDALPMTPSGKVDYESLRKRTEAVSQNLA